MNALRHLVTASLVVVFLGTGRFHSAAAQTPADRADQARFAASLQNSDGGFAARPGGDSDLGATISCLRILRFCGGSVPDVLSCIDFVRSCHDEETGGFAAEPGGEPSVRLTALGLMALDELRLEEPEIIEHAVAYLSDEAESFGEIRIAIAGLEAIGARSKSFDAWTTGILERRNADGTWGEGAAVAFDTGGTAAALLRMGVELQNPGAVAEAILDGQNDDGGWSSDGSGSTLSATYRVVRCLHMMDAPPDLEALRSFIASCRRPDGGYAPSSEVKASAVGSTYMALILLRWANQFENLPPLVETAGFQPLIHGSSLDGWDGDDSLWSVENGVLVGSSPGIDHNEFLATEASYGDFILKFAFRLRDGEGNSGVQFRSKRLPGHEMAGYQADIGEGYWGSLYDESRRNRVLAEASEAARASVREADWNRYVIRAMGPRIRLYLNDRLSVDYLEEDEEIADAGKIAPQVHSGGPMEIRFRDLWIQPMPRPATDGDDTKPGFHLRTLESDGEPYSYVVFVPENYDGETKVPVLLFLHGAGERGTDAITPAQVGLGPSLEANRSAFPAIAIFPQARETWRAGSDDAERALAALDDVINDYVVDRSRVVLTGLSMGGMGTWSIAASHPERFSALVPVCGAGDPSTAATLKDLPAWIFVGDQDSRRFVGGSRAMARALIDQGAEVRHTEYRGIGHNSWDRAYSEPGLFHWIFSKRRTTTEDDGS